MMVSAPLTRSAIQVGFWSAVTTAIFCILFSIAAALAAPWDVVLPIAPSLVLAPAFLIMLVCVNAAVPGEKKIWSQVGVAFAAVYVPLCSAAYIVEMFVVEPRVMNGRASEVALLTLTRGDTILNAVDGIGYIFMCLATLFAASAFVGGHLLSTFRTGLQSFGDQMSSAPTSFSWPPRTGLMELCYSTSSSLWGLAGHPFTRVPCFDGPLT